MTPDQRFIAAMPSIRFFLANTDHPITSSHPLWRQPLPDRKAAGSAVLSGFDTATLTYGDYFNAVSNFCASNAWNPIKCAARRALQRPVTDDEISRLSVFLEKHGALYHPARLLVCTPDQDISFVINVAASAKGRRTLPVEMRALKQLGEQRPFGWLPTVYDSTDDPIPMFLADWFDGYHEFHLTHPFGERDLSLIVWDGADRPHLLSEPQAADLYQQATMILTACYDPITTNQIFPWHHAAGDFVVRVKDNTVDVKLITARDYAPIFTMEKAPADERVLLDSLIAFFLHLSFCMRLDRLDGVSQMVWAPEACLPPMIDGFFNGLDLAGRLSGFPDTFPSLFHDYFNHQGAELVMKKADQLAQSVFDPQCEERRIVDRHLKRHVHQICQCIRNKKIG